MSVQRVIFLINVPKFLLENDFLGVWSQWPYITGDLSPLSPPRFVACGCIQIGDIVDKQALTAKILLRNIQFFHCMPFAGTPWPFSGGTDCYAFALGGEEGIEAMRDISHTREVATPLYMTLALSWV